MNEESTKNEKSLEQQKTYEKTLSFLEELSVEEIQDIQYTYHCDKLEHGLYRAVFDLWKQFMGEKESAFGLVLADYGNQQILHNDATTNDGVILIPREQKVWQKSICKEPWNFCFAGEIFFQYGQVSAYRETLRECEIDVQEDIGALCVFVPHLSQELKDSYFVQTIMILPDFYDWSSTKSEIIQKVKNLVERKYDHLVSRTIDWEHETSEQILNANRAEKQVRTFEAILYKNHARSQSFSDLILEAYQPFQGKQYDNAIKDLQRKAHRIFHKKKPLSPNAFVKEEDTTVFYPALLHPKKLEWFGSEMEYEADEQIAHNVYRDLRVLAERVRQKSDHLRLADFPLKYVRWVRDLRQKLYVPAGWAENFDAIVGLPLHLTHSREPKYDEKNGGCLAFDLIDQMCINDTLTYLLEYANVRMNDSHILYCDGMGTEAGEKNRIELTIPDYGNDTWTDLWIDLVASACLKLKLNDDKCRVQYLLLYQDTELGKRAREQETKQQFSAQFYLPPRDLQDAVVLSNTIAQQAANNMNVIRKGIAMEEGFPGMNESTVDFSSARMLPQPLSSALYVADCEEEQTKKNRELLNYFEASAEFVTACALSILAYEDRKSLLQVIGQSIFKAPEDNSEEKKKKIKKPNIFQFTYGTWVSGNGKGLLEQAWKQHDTAVRFSTEKLRIDVLSSLDEGRKLRNAAAHGGRETDGSDKLTYDACIQLAVRLAQQLWYLFRSFDFLYVTNALNKQVDEEGDASVCEIRAYEVSA